MLLRTPVGQVPRLPTGSRVYAIGDVHGEAALLVRLLHLIKADSDSRKNARVILVFLGDLIDRGPDGAMLLRTFSRIADDDDVIVLKGNHEEALEDAYSGNEATLADWLCFGAQETLSGFGITASELSTGTTKLLAALHAQIDPKLARWLATLPLHWQRGDYFFVHAGVRPGVKLDRQKTRDLMWIREPFLSSRRDHGKVIVHGHSVELGLPTLGGNRIGIDTGGHENGTLTALGLEDSDQWLLQAHQASQQTANDAIGSQSHDRHRPATLLSAVAPEEIEQLITSIVAARDRPDLSAAPLLELTAGSEFKPQLKSRRLGTQGYALGAFAIALSASGAAMTGYVHWRTAPRSVSEIFIAQVPAVSRPLSPFIAAASSARSSAEKARSIFPKARRPIAREIVVEHHINADAPPTTSIEARVENPPKLYGSELEKALAEDRVATRQLNTDELAQVQSRADRVRR